MVYVAPGAVVTGQVALGEKVNLWYGAVLRGDSGEITVGEGTNIQEHCILHEKTRVGAYCTVGHRAILHGCTVGEETLIGMGSIVLNGAKIGPRCMVGAGSLVTGKMDAPEGSLIMGSPAKVVLPLTEEEIAALKEDALHDIKLAEKSLPIKE